MKVSTSVFSSDYKISYLWVIWFFICLLPFSIGDGFSANYLFALTPIFSYKNLDRQAQPIKIIKIFLAVYLLIFGLSLLLGNEMVELIGRRFISFLIFISVFTLTWVRIDKVLLNSFYCSLILISCCLSVQSILLFTGTDLRYDAATAKVEIGTQRVGFMYIFSLGVSMYILDSFPIGTISKYVLKIISFIILFGLFLTFSRSSIVGLFVSLLLWVLVGNRKMADSLILIAKTCLIAVPSYLLLALVFPTIQDLFLMPMVNSIKNGDLFENSQNSDSSEGYRIALWRVILEETITRPLTGSGFLGVFVIDKLIGSDENGSAHNQYLDIIFRVGFIGFFIYVYLLFRIAANMFKNSRLIFVGFIGVIAYGMFHETFKTSQGAAILAVLIGELNSKQAGLNARKIRPSGEQFKANV